MKNKNYFIPDIAHYSVYPINQYVPVKVFLSINLKVLTSVNNF